VFQFYAFVEHMARLHTNITWHTSCILHDIYVILNHAD